MSKDVGPVILDSSKNYILNEIYSIEFLRQKNQTIPSNKVETILHLFTFQTPIFI